MLLRVSLSNILISLCIDILTLLVKKPYFLIGTRFAYLLLTVLNDNNTLNLNTIITICLQRLHLLCKQITNLKKQSQSRWALLY